MKPRAIPGQFSKTQTPMLTNLLLVLVAFSRLGIHDRICGGQFGKGHASLRALVETGAKN